MADSTCMSVGALVGCLAIPGPSLKPSFVGESQVCSIVGCVQGWLRQKRNGEGKPLYAITRPPRHHFHHFHHHHRSIQLPSHPSTTSSSHPHTHCIAHQTSPPMGAMLLHLSLHHTTPLHKRHTPEKKRCSLSKPAVTPGNKGLF
ncbi:hypothetical protein CKAH01_00230 [Colletotrichum kahawae]|uniref:Uncharacterized protein n=1 Tax=Colletotrichum kahawae TaxID=34407 RepID=A0AAD9YVK6_COLKA|nr:hypothetical protein CKAH01_00230 [Colletotrichum kahawae]